MALSTLQVPSRSARTPDRAASQYAVMQVRIDKNKEAKRLAQAEQYARDWNFVRGGDPDKGEEPRPNLTGMINFIWDAIESEESFRNHLELVAQNAAIREMSAAIDEMANSDDEVEREWAESEGAAWMEKAEANASAMADSVVEALS